MNKFSVWFKSLRKSEKNLLIIIGFLLFTFVESTAVSAVQTRVVTKEVVRQVINEGVTPLASEIDVTPEIDTESLRTEIENSIIDNINTNLDGTNVSLTEDEMVHLAELAADKIVINVTKGDTDLGLDENNVSEINGQISSLKEQLNGYTSQISEINTKIEKVNTAISGLDGTKTISAADAQQILTDYNGLVEKYNNLVEKYNGLVEDVANVNKTMTNNDETLKKSIQETQTELKKLSTED